MKQYRDIQLMTQNNLIEITIVSHSDENLYIGNRLARLRHVIRANSRASLICLKHWTIHFDI